ncbi:MAG: hypothetical protein V7637_6689 [Mycobacteriales bacterium]
MRLKTERGTRPIDTESGSAGIAWLAAVRRGDRGAFNTTVRHTQEQLASHLLGALRLPSEQALELTQQTVLDALETAGQGTTIESPLARLFGTARARLHDRLRATFGDIAGLDVPFDPEPDSALLRAFHAGDRSVDRQVAHRRDVLPFLELMHEVVQSLPDEPRAILAARWSPDDPAEDEPSRYPPALLALAGVALMAHTRPGYCAVFDEHLSRAEWRPGEPLRQPLQQSVLYHVGACSECRPSHQQAEQRIDSLPPLLLWVALRLDEQRREILATIFTGSTTSSTTTALPAPGVLPGTNPTTVTATTTLDPAPPEAPAPAPAPTPPATGPAPAPTPAPARPSVARPPAGRQRPTGRRADAGPATPSQPATDRTKRDRAKRRRLVGAVLVFGLAGFGGWGLIALGGDGTQAPLAIDNGAAADPVTGDPTASGPPSGSITATGTTGAPTTGASSQPATSSAGASSTAPPADPTTASVGQAPTTPPGSSPATPTQPGTGAASSPASSGPPADGQLLVRLAPLSTGGVTVLIGGAEAGSCTDACAFAVRPGQQVTLDPKDVALSWGGTPCASTAANGNCTFTASARNEANPLVMRLSF